MGDKKNRKNYCFRKRTSNANISDRLPSSSSGAISARRNARPLARWVFNELDSHLLGRFLIGFPVHHAFRDGGPLLFSQLLHFFPESVFPLFDGFPIFGRVLRPFGDFPLVDFLHLPVFQVVQGPIAGQGDKIGFDGVGGVYFLPVVQKDEKHVLGDVFGGFLVFHVSRHELRDGGEIGFVQLAESVVVQRRSVVHSVSLRKWKLSFV